MLADERYNIILEMASEDGIIKTAQIKDRLEVSLETVRRDLNYLEKQGKLYKIFGGAKLVSSSNLQLSYDSFSKRTRNKTEEKIRIAKKATEFIVEGQSLALDSGTTSLELAYEIKRKFKKLTVVTNSLNVLNALTDAEGFTIILTGGIYKFDECAFVSDISTAIFENLNIKTFFLTTCGVSVEKGVTYQRVDEILVQRKMMESSEQTILIADSSKIGENSLVQMCGLEEINMIITDDNISKEQVDKFNERGIKIIKA
ncbi:MAG: DeoR/GlpR family DNA-binding transcription regulator [Filifactoraceae bacterium]